MNRLTQKPLSLNLLWRHLCQCRDWRHLGHLLFHLFPERGPEQSHGSGFQHRLGSKPCSWKILHFFQWYLYDSFVTFHDIMRCCNLSMWGVVRYGEVCNLPDLPLSTGGGFLVPLTRENCHGRGRHEPPLDLWLVPSAERHMIHGWYMVHALPSCYTEILTSVYIYI